MSLWTKLSELPVYIRALTGTPLILELHTDLLRHEGEVPASVASVAAECEVAVLVLVVLACFGDWHTLAK